MSAKNFDYVVIGAGGAGAIVAARLSEDPGVRVLLLESGPKAASVYLKMPAALAFPLSDPRLTWSFETGPEPYLDGRRITHVRGRVMGGSTSVNGMVYVRGNPRDYERWATEGLADWDYAHCLPYFKKLERYAGGEAAYRGRSGPVGITRAPARNPLFDAFLAAGQQAGHELNDDYNGYRQEGVHVYQTNIDRGHRASTVKAYLEPAAGRRNLTVRSGVEVRRIRFSNKRAVGVELVTADGRSEVIDSDREIIVSGGTFKSPQILMLSGLGDPTELRAADVPVVAEVPGVGRGLEDHPAVSVAYRSARRGVSPVGELGLLRKGRIGAEWLFLRSGLGATNFWETGSFFRSDHRADFANIQHEFCPMLGEFSHGEVTVADGFQYQTCLMRPRSRGAVTLRSGNPADPPQVVTNFLQHPEDVRELMNAVRHTDEIIRQPAWDGLRGDAVVPGLAELGDDALHAWLRQNVSTQYHPCGTCRMGTDDDSVVDNEGRVHGVEALRVIDASVMPHVTSGNLNCPTMMVAEKLADRVKGATPLPPEKVAYF